MNSTASLARNETPKIQRNAEPQPLGVVGEAPRPKSWSYMHRAKWARALPVSRGARFTAVCIADHINEKTGQWNLSSAQIAAETGRIGKYADRAVRRHINNELRTHFHVEDRPGRMWRFTIPAPMMAVVEPRTKCPDTPDILSDVPSKRPSKYKHPPARQAEMPDFPEHLEAIKDHGVRCRRCSHEWPRAAGLSHICTRQPERTERPSRPKRTRGGRSTDTISERINRERLTRIRAERERADDEAFEASLADRTARELRENTAASMPMLSSRVSLGCPACGHDRIMGGSCDQCGHDCGTGFRPSADWNMEEIRE